MALVLGNSLWNLNSRLIFWHLLINNFLMHTISISASPSQAISSYLLCWLFQMPQSKRFLDPAGTSNLFTLLLFNATFLLTWLCISWSIITITPSYIRLTPLLLVPFFILTLEKTQTCLNPVLHLFCFHVNWFDHYSILAFKFMTIN